MARCIVKTTGINGCARYMLGYTESAIMWTTNRDRATIFDDGIISGDFLRLHPKDQIEIVRLT